MSKIVETFTADMARVRAVLADPDGEPRPVAYAREQAAVKQASIDAQDLGWPTTVPDALEAILNGTVDTADGFGMAYHHALFHIVSSVGSDLWDLAVWSRPYRFLSSLGEELAALGVPRDMLPLAYISGNVPLVHLPTAPDGPELGYLPLAEAGPVADAYTAVAGKVSGDFTYDLDLITARLRDEHQMWRDDQEAGRHGGDTLFFWTTG